MTRKDDVVEFRAPGKAAIAIIAALSGLAGAAASNIPSWMSQQAQAPASAQGLDANQVAHDAIQQRLGRVESQLDTLGNKLDRLIQRKE